VKDKALELHPAYAPRTRNAKHRLTLRLLYGLDGYPQMSVEETAEFLQISVGRVRERRRIAMRVLGHGGEKHFLKLIRLSTLAKQMFEEAAILPAKGSRKPDLEVLDSWTLDVNPNRCY
jgi:DNA-binding CsgD family transcriptional regulator